MYNHIAIIGNLGRDPEVRATNSGVKVANFSVATSETYKDRHGEKKTTTQWHKVVAWDKLAETCEKYIRKGSKVLVTGQLEYRKWTDKKDVEHETAEIRAREVKFLDPKDKDTQSGQRPEHDGGSQQVTDDDIPF